MFWTGENEKMDIFEHPIWKYILAAFISLVLYLFAVNIRLIYENTETIKQQCIEQK